MQRVIEVDSYKAFILASRPKTLGAMSCPILMGNAFAIVDQTFIPIYFVLTLICSLGLQILANLINDYGDFLKGADSIDRLGPPRAMQMGFITKKAMEKGIALLTMFISLLGCFLVLKAGILVFFFGLISLLLCFFYTLGKRPLAYLGFVEIIVFLVFGPLSVCGSYYIHAGSFPVDILFASLSPGFLAAALLLTNNLRDSVQDKKNGKYTIAVRLNQQFCRILLVTLLLMALLVPIILKTAFSYSWPIFLASVALIIPARYFHMVLYQPISKKFNLMLSAIGQCLYLYGLLMSLGIIYGAP